MSAGLNSKDEYFDQLSKKYGDNRKAEFDAEREMVWSYFELISAQLGLRYDITRVLAVGGTGVVHLGTHKRFNQPVVVKMNRPNVEPDGTSMVANEASVLPSFSHPNIISVLDLDTISTVSPALTYIVEPFISGSKPFFVWHKEGANESWLSARLEEIRQALPLHPQFGAAKDAGQATSLFAALLNDLAALFAEWVSLLSHLHFKGFVYLDVKPENVLVDPHRHLTSIDFGSVERLDKTDHTPIDVFFTNRYAHPELIKSKKEKASSNRVRGGLKRSELTEQFDFYALGISFLEILNEVATLSPHSIPQLPLYRSLHFLATRLLNGRNSGRPSENHYQYASQVFPTLRDTDYNNLSYTTLTEAHRDLEKERGRWNLENEVPELATYSKDIVRVVAGYNTVLTQRLKMVIEHPLVARLKYVSQLGLVSLVYPTADHSRYEHALGSYTYTTYYIKSLFNDLGNPVFRNLVGNEDLNAVLLAALLHDLGQYPLAHDLEEVHEGIFKHTRLGMELLEDSTPDQYGRTLSEIIENPKYGWGVCEKNVDGRMVGLIKTLD